MYQKKSAKIWDYENSLEKLLPYDIRRTIDWLIIYKREIEDAKELIEDNTKVIEAGIKVLEKHGIKSEFAKQWYLETIDY